MLHKSYSLTEFAVNPAKSQTLETTGLLSPINPLGLSFISFLIKQLNLLPSMNSLITRALLDIIMPMILYATLQNTLYLKAESQISSRTPNIRWLPLIIISNLNLSQFDSYISSNGSPLHTI